MVTRRASSQAATRNRCQRRLAGFLQIDLVIAMAIVVVALIPLATTIRTERQLCRAQYYRAVAMSIVDGETEILKAGEWRAYAEGEHAYVVTAEAASELPKGQFRLTRNETQIRLEWIPSRKANGGRIFREFSLESKDQP